MLETDTLAFGDNPDSTVYCGSFTRILCRQQIGREVAFCVVYSIDVINVQIKIKKT